MSLSKRNLADASPVATLPRYVVLAPVAGGRTMIVQDRIERRQIIIVADEDLQQRTLDALNQAAAALDHVRIGKAEPD